MTVFFVVIDPVGNILRTGQCWSEDAALQGDFVLVLDRDPLVSGLTHSWDHEAAQFIQIEAVK